MNWRRGNCRDSFFPRKILSFYRELRILAIETSCDDTSVCLLENNKYQGPVQVVYHKTQRSLNENEKFGGIHPQVSIISHQRNLSHILKQAFDQHIRGQQNIDLIAATQGPGMVGSLSVGLNTAKGLSVALGVPLIGIHHMVSIDMYDLIHLSYQQAHSLTPRLINSGKFPEFPYLSLLLSGGHTLLIRSRSVIDHDILASTLDISVGDMIDKCARLLKVDWNGMMPGQALENWSKSGDTSIDTGSVWDLPDILMKTAENQSKLAFSFSGLGSCVDRIVKRSSLTESQLKSLARSLQISAFTHISHRLLLGLKKIDDYITGIVISGGVARNSFLKTILHTTLNNSPYKHLPLFFPPTELCSDNSAMIAWTAYEMYNLGYVSDLSILPIRKWPIDRLLELGKYKGYGKTTVHFSFKGLSVYSNLTMVDGILDISLPTFDLNSYINNYKGYTRIERLIFISERCSILSVEALKFAIELSQTETLDVVLYEKLVIGLQQKDPSDCNIALNTEWIHETKNDIKNTLQKLNSELKNYKNSFIKESIRMGYKDLADYYYLCRDLENSLKFYLKACEYCTTSKHNMDTLVNVIKIFLELKDFVNVNTYFAKIQNMFFKNEVTSKIEVISGLIYLNMENYKEAALKFCMIKTGEDMEFDDIISVNDLVIYAVVCALSSFSRSELKQYIIENDGFWTLHELEPQVFEIVIAFYSSNYLKCFDILNRLKNDFMLDIYLNRHVDNLFLYIRQSAYISYLKPFSYVDLRKMADSFLFLLNNMEKELIQLILESKICAKIDNINKFLIILEPYQQDMVYEKILKISNEYKRSAKLSLIHMELVKKGLEIKTTCDLNIDIENE